MTDIARRQRGPQKQAVGNPRRYRRDLYLLQALKLVRCILVVQEEPVVELEGVAACLVDQIEQRVKALGVDARALEAGRCAEVRWGQVSTASRDDQAAAAVRGSAASTVRAVQSGQY